MYYEEKIINGILCYRCYPDGEWRELSKKDLTNQINKLKEKLKEQEEKQLAEVCHNCGNQKFNETMGCKNYSQGFKCINFKKINK